MKKYIVVLLALSLVACSSVKPRHAAMNNEGASFITKCAQIEVAVAETSEKLAALKRQKLSSDVGNGINDEAPVSLNPLEDFDHTRTIDVEAAIQNYSERLARIENLGELLNCKFDVTASPKLAKE